MTDNTAETEKDSFDQEFHGDTITTTDDDEAALCGASFSHTCACTI